MASTGVFPGWRSLLLVVVVEVLKEERSQNRRGRMAELVNNGRVVFS